MDAADREAIHALYEAVDKEIEQHKANPPAFAAQGWGRWIDRLKELLAERSKYAEMVRRMNNGGRDSSIP
jgi:hypothetical protein